MFYQQWIVPQARNLTQKEREEEEGEGEEERCTWMNRGRWN